MNTQQAYIKGFIKRASEYGLNEHEAIELLKSSEAPPPVAAPQANPTVLKPQPLKPRVDLKPASQWQNLKNFFTKGELPPAHTVPAK